MKKEKKYTKGKRTSRTKTHKKGASLSLQSQLHITTLLHYKKMNETERRVKERMVSLVSKERVSFFNLSFFLFPTVLSSQMRYMMG